MSSCNSSNLLKFLNVGEKTIPINIIFDKREPPILKGEHFKKKTLSKKIFIRVWGAKLPQGVIRTFCVGVMSSFLTQGKLLANKENFS